MSTLHLLPLAVLLPITAGALAPALFLRRPAGAWWWALAAATANLAMVWMLWREAQTGDVIRYPLGGWPAPYGIELVFDGIAMLMLVLAVLSVLILIAARRYIDATVPRYRRSLVYALLLINLGGMNGFVAAADLFNLFVFMEIFSITAYALVALARGPVAALAALKYLLVGAVSSLLVLLAVALLYAQTGSLNMADVAERLAAAEAPGAAALALGCLAVGFLVKAAIFPLHFWLPDAHASAPSPVSALLSGLVVKMGVVGLLRTQNLFTDAAVVPIDLLSHLLVWLGAIAVLAGATLALVQRELKLMLAYSTVANMGYIALGLGLASTAAVGGALAHTVYHAVIKTGLFLTAGAILLATGLSRVDDLRGLGTRMPLTCMALVIGLLAATGIPTTAGFVGKWQIAVGSLEAGRPLVIPVILAGSLLTLSWSIRVINSLFFRPPARARVILAQEAPASLLIPSLLLALLSLVGGWAGAVSLQWVEPLTSRLAGTPSW